MSTVKRARPTQENLANLGEYMADYAIPGTEPTAYGLLNATFKVPRPDVFIAKLKSKCGTKIVATAGVAGTHEVKVEFPSSEDVEDEEDEVADKDDDAVSSSTEDDDEDDSSSGEDDGEEEDANGEA